jgi:vitamin B12 transporter
MRALFLVLVPVALALAPAAAPAAPVERPGGPAVPSPLPDPPPAIAGPDGAVASSEPNKPVFYETTTVTARPVSAAAGAVTVLDATEIETSQARSATEALTNVPGLNTLSSGGRAGASNAFIRGGDPNYTLVLLDGIPLNDATELQGGAVNLEELSANLVDHVEVVRGPLTSFYGSNALSGVVQLFAPRGTFGPMRVATGLEAGNAGLRRGYGRVSGAAGAGSYAVGASWDQQAHQIGADRFRQLEAWATGDLALGAGSALAVTGRVADGASDDYPDASAGPALGTGLLRHTDHRDIDLGARLDIGAPTARRQQLLVGLARRDLDRTSPAIPPMVPESEEHTAFTRLRIGWQLPLVSAPRTSVDVGVTGEGEWGENASVLRSPAFPGGEAQGDYAKRRLNGGVYAGARYERGALLYEAALRTDATTGSSLQANPHLGVVWHSGDSATRLRASFGRASKMPSFYALASPRALGGNPDLRPEHVWGGEAGAERRLDALALELGVSYFRQELNDLVDFDFDSFQLVNRARVRTEGVEMTASWRPHRSLSIEGQATYLSVHDRAGAELLHTPHWTGGGRLIWRPTTPLTLRLQVRGTSGYLDRQYPVPDRDSVEGNGLLGASGAWRVRAGLTLRARAENLTNRRYETLIGFPGPGRSFWAGVGWERP